ncbi:unnamed protein product, partial [Brenthis ino]
MINAVNEFLDDLRGGRMIDSPIVRVEDGELQGKLVNSPNGKAFYCFQGVPYAKPPIGSLRFRAPQPPEPWEGVRDATSEGNVSAQLEPLFLKEYIGDENCLFLNVYTPNLDGEFLPVMVFIHGGAFQFGSGNASLYGGDYLVEKDVVVVTINYRVGALGFLCLNTPEVPGNAGLKDIVQALRWVHQNIKSFGGNSGNITVFGESAGGAIVSLLTASPMSKSLINKGIVQSGCALSHWAIQKKPIENAKLIAEELGCESSDIGEILEFLTTTPLKDLIEAQEKLFPFEGRLKNLETSFVPVVEKEFNGVEAFMTEPFINILTSGRVANIPIMIGTTTLEFAGDFGSDDLQSFIPKDLNIERNTPQSLEIAEKIKGFYFKGNPTSVESLSDKFHLVSDMLININMHRYIRYLINVTNKPVYYYKFDYVGALNLPSNLFKHLDLKQASHMDELGYLFKNDLQKGVEVSPQDEKTRERMLRLWTNFAKSGNPTPDENHYLTVTWLPITKDNLYYLNISNELSLGTNPDKEKMELWEDVYSKYFKIWDQVDKEEEKFEYSTGPVIVEETIITTVTTVTNGEEVTETQVLVDVHDNFGGQVHIAESEHKQDNIQTEPIENNKTEVEEEKVSVEEEKVKVEEEKINVAKEKVNIVEEKEKVNFVQSERKVTETEDFGVNIGKIQEKFEHPHNGVEFNGNSDRKPRPSNEIKMVQNNNINPKDVIRANDPPEDDLPKNIGVNKFVNFFESLGGKK